MQIKSNKFQTIQKFSEKYQSHYIDHQNDFLELQDRKIHLTAF